MRQLLRAGFPPVKLFILFSYWSPFFDLGYDYIISIFSDTVNGFVESDPITTSVVEEYNFPKDMANVNGYTALRYTAEIEPDPWNELLFSHTYIAYKWTYFTLVLGVLLYTCARIIRLTRLKILKQNLLLIAFVTGFVYCIFFLIHLAALGKTYLSLIFLRFYVFLAGTPFDIILLHCIFNNNDNSFLAYYHH
ncbi:hypothetical protein BDF19DRAFT_166221 [Syncephalis fuscata]|nr:hypothetical protein BDF19DRAFT_166221 [Syncephalis fuscata]